MALTFTSWTAYTDDDGNAQTLDWTLGGIQYTPPRSHLEALRQAALERAQAIQYVNAAYTISPVLQQAVVKEDWLQNVSRSTAVIKAIHDVFGTRGLVGYWLDSDYWLLDMAGVANPGIGALLGGGSAFGTRQASTLLLAQDVLDAYNRLNEMVEVYKNPTVAVAGGQINQAVHNYTGYEYPDPLSAYAQCISTYNAQGYSPASGMPAESILVSAKQDSGDYYDRDFYIYRGQGKYSLAITKPAVYSPVAKVFAVPYGAGTGAIIPFFDYDGGGAAGVVREVWSGASPASWTDVWFTDTFLSPLSVSDPFPAVPEPFLPPPGVSGWTATITYVVSWATGWGTTTAMYGPGVVLYFNQSPYPDGFKFVAP